MSPPEIIIAAMGAAGPRAAFDPVRIQKLLFLVDREIPDLVEGPHFDFKPYDYGPFDKAVYEHVRELIEERYVAVDHRGSYPLYSLTESGHAAAASILSACRREVSDYLTLTARWILSMNFRALVAAIYAEFPDMAVRSKLRLTKPKYRYPAICSPKQAFFRGFARAFDPAAFLDDGIPTWLEPASDSAAIESDWRTVGDDLRRAMGAVGGWRRR